MKINMKQIELEFKEKINNLTQAELDKCCIDYVSRLHTLRTIISKNIIDEVFGSTDDIQQSFNIFKHKLIRAFELEDW